MSITIHNIEEQIKNCITNIINKPTLKKEIIINLPNSIYTEIFLTQFRELTLAMAQRHYVERSLLKQIEENKSYDITKDYTDHEHTYKTICCSLMTMFFDHNGQVMALFKNIIATIYKLQEDIPGKNFHNYKISEQEENLLKYLMKEIPNLIKEKEKEITL